MADDDFSLLVARMVWIVEDPGQRIDEHCQGLIEGNAAFLDVRAGFLRVPSDILDSSDDPEPTMIRESRLGLSG